MCSAPMPPPKYSPKPYGEPKRLFSSRKNVSSAMIFLGLNSSFSIGFSVKLDSGHSSPSAGGSSLGSSLLAKSFQTSRRRIRASS